MMWTGKQKQALDDWWSEKENRGEVVNLPGDFLEKRELTRSDIELLRSIPGFKDVESQVIPTSNKDSAKKLALEYDSIDSVPLAYLESLKKDGLTYDDIEEAFTKRQKQGKYNALVKEQEQRAKDLEEAQEFSSDKSLAQNTLAMLHKFTPKEADRHFIQYGIKDNGDITSNLGLVSSAILGAAANGLEILPFPLLGTLGAPALRLAESAKSELPYSLADAGKDAAFNALGYGPLTKLGDLVKSTLGGFLGPALEKTSIPNFLGRIAQNLDNAALGDKAITNREKLQAKYRKVLEEKIPNMDKIEVEKTARKMENDNFPNLANAVREYNVTTQGGIPVSLTEEALSDLLIPSRYKLSSDKKKLLYNDRNVKNYGKEVKMPNIHSAGTKKNRQAAIDRAVALSPNESTKIVAKALNYGARPFFRYKTNPDVANSNMVRQWEAGFVPRKGTDLYEQYLVWKEAQGDK